MDRIDHVGERGFLPPIASTPVDQLPVPVIPIPAWSGPVPELPAARLQVGSMLQSPIRVTGYGDIDILWPNSRSDPGAGVIDDYRDDLFRG